MAKRKNKSENSEPAPEVIAVESQKPEPVPVAVAVKSDVWVVAPGKALTCKKGLLGPGTEIYPQYVDDQKAFQKLKDRGYIVQAKV